VKAAVRAVAGVAAGAASACTLLVSTSGLTDGQRVSSEGGASADAPPAGSTPDASPADAGVSRRDAGFCGAHPTALFCEDFDGPAVLASALSEQGGSVQTIAAAGAPSPPDALEAILSTSTSGLHFAYYTPPSFAVPNTFHIAFDVSLVEGEAMVFEVAAAASDAIVFNSQLLGSADYIVYQEFISYADGGNTPAFSWAPPLAFTSGWHHVEVCFDLTTASRTVEFDGQKDSGTGLPAWPTPMAFRFGLPYQQGPVARMDAQIDNVLFDTAACP
jgi:hypothetical protein